MWKDRNVREDFQIVLPGSETPISAYNYSINLNGFSVFILIRWKKGYSRGGEGIRYNIYLYNIYIFYIKCITYLWSWGPLWRSKMLRQTSTVVRPCEVPISVRSSRSADSRLWICCTCWGLSLLWLRVPRRKNKNNFRWDDFFMKTRIHF